MAHLLSHLNPIPKFPPYTGPYKVGTLDIEIPITSLPSPSPAPDPSISTVQFRIFYPCETPQKSPKTTYWIPEPQREYLGAYARFLGASPTFSEFFSYLPRTLYHITIPVLRNARLLPAPTRAKKWPVMFFSHGLGGSRNAYSHLLGSLSSHGVVVVAPDHRDGSAPMALVNGEKKGDIPKRVEYKSMPHTPSKQVEEERNDQLRIRLWELGLAHEAMLKIERGEEIVNLAVKTEQSLDQNLSMFRSSLNVQVPGSITWAGHSFGAATVVQFVKSTFWHSPGQNRSFDPYLAEYRPLYTPSSDSSIVRQITPGSPVALLDLWTLPLRGDPTRWLWNKPLPCYAQNGPGGVNLLAILSEAFYKWRGNLVHTKKVLSSDPSSQRPAQSSRPGPRIFYPVSSAHLSQSDFGILFPWVTRKVFKADNPERTLRLNTRAILQVMRESGIEVAETSRIDMEEDEQAEKVENGANGHLNGHMDGSVSKIDAHAANQDWRILATNGKVKGWIALNVYENDAAKSTNGLMDAEAMPGEAVMKSEVMDGDSDRERL
ncbi:MAG: hypothetical protein M1830_002455 [Pleopsidium flavum]|nr:MAG: hypothetical protein M1830_002455 [Pleopsidium flavum]